VEDCATDSSIIVTIGAAATGKSTFTKRLLNRLLTGHGKSARSLPAVCYLDLDTSKPEYTTQGQISLAVIKLLNLGPNFSHAETAFPPSGLKRNEIVRSHPMPPNLVNYKDYYRACVEDLFLAYKSLQSQESLLPLVINTPGSLYTHHCDLLTALLARFKPHHIVHLGDVRANDAEDTAKLHALHTVVAHYRGTIHQIAEHVPVFPPMKTDVELRAMQMQSYFHLDKVKPGEVRAIPWAPRPVSELVPWELCYEETDERVQDFVGFAMYSDPIESASLVNSLNGSIVQILESTSSLIPTPYTGLSRTTRYRVPFFQTSSRTGMVEPLDPRTSKLVCTAFVRSFDPDSRVVQLVVPRAYDRLLYDLIPERTVLVGGCCEQPEWAYLEDAGVVGKAGGSQLDSSDKLERIHWVSEKAHFDDMGYLNTVRRVRKFQT
jgi:polynucleotide 5'-hydroxyl-kinase GRC3/NOL9